jgi:hypothetical protein
MLDCLRYSRAWPLKRDRESPESGGHGPSRLGHGNWRGSSRVRGTRNCGTLVPPFSLTRYMAEGAHRVGRTVYIGDKPSSASSSKSTHGNSCGGNSTTSDANMRRTGDGCGCLLFICLLIPLCSYFAENNFHERMVAFREIEDHIQATDHCPSTYSSLSSCLDSFASNWPVHVKSENFGIKSSVEDTEFGLRFENVVRLLREVEYCQWSESYKDDCLKCHREVDGKNETYDCQCLRTYHYHKKWRAAHIDSSKFDQVLVTPLVLLSCRSGIAFALPLPGPRLRPDPRAPPRRSRLRTTIRGGTTPTARTLSAPATCSSATSRSARRSPPVCPPIPAGPTGSAATCPPGWPASTARRRRRAGRSRTWATAATSSRRTRPADTSSSTSTTCG